jgi:hypothetical protein
MRHLIDLLRRFWRDERGGWFIWLLVAIAFQVIAFLLRPRPKKTQPPEASDLENPVAEAGKPVPVVFGTLTVKGLNVLWFGEKQKHTSQIDA